MIGYYTEVCILRNKWVHMHQRASVSGWDSLEQFEQWCKETGYEEGAKLKRIDTKKPFSPENCYWLKTEVKPKECPEVKKWNRTVNVIRKHFGLPLFEE